MGNMLQQIFRNSKFDDLFGIISHGGTKHAENTEEYGELVNAWYCLITKRMLPYLHDTRRMEPVCKSSGSLPG
jgi:hypothetical protein